MSDLDSIFEKAESLGIELEKNPETIKKAAMLVALYGAYQIGKMSLIEFKKMLKNREDKKKLT